MPKGSGVAGTDRASEKYLAAAKEIDSRKNDFHSCHAVAMQEGYQYPFTFFAHKYQLVMRYADLFRPDGLERPEIWFSGFHKASEIKSIRVLMLCFMAAMVEAGDA